VSGRILDASGKPIKDALVEIWQCDNNGVYLHPGSDNAGKRDSNFQGFGRFLTGFYRRVLLPHDQASALRPTHAAHFTTW
jgi:protocatechuate 3,4-dioxygenase beta subunit